MIKNLFILSLALCVIASGADDEHGAAGGRKRYTTKDGKSVYLPKLLTNDFYRPEDVCKDASEKKRPFALVAMKSHACDCTINCNFCLEETRNITDRANTLLFDHFAAYHIRLTRHPEISLFSTKKLDVEKLEVTPGAYSIAPTWLSLTKKFVGNSAGPGLLVMDTKTCKVAGFIPMDKIPVESSPGDPKKREARAKETNEIIREALRKVRPITDALRNVVDDTRPPLDPQLAKLHPELPLRDYVSLLDEQLEKEDKEGKGFLKNQGNNEKP